MFNRERFKQLRFNNSKFYKSNLACAISAAVLSTSVSASVLEEVVVTAQKREQSLQDVGIAVSAFTGDQMKSLGWDSSDDVVSQTPGVSLVQPNGPSSFYINIRGVAQNDFSGDNQESPVAVYVDDVYVASPSGAGFQLFDFERVEILRGPQGTLFGRNATGGLVHYVTRKPSQETDGYMSLTLGDYDQTDIEGAIGGGITDTVSGRLSFTSNQHDAIIENRGPGSDLNDNDVWAARGQLLFEFDYDTELLLNVRAGELDNTNAPFEHRAARADADGLGSFYNGGDLTQAGYSDADGGKPHEGEYNVPGFVKIETQGYTATFKTELDNGYEFVSITDFNTLERDYLEDSDASPNDFFAFALKSDMEQFSQEFRLSGETDRMRWVGGAYYMKYEGDLFIGGAAGEFFNAAFGLSGPGAFGPEFGLDSPFKTTTESTAFFGQVEYDLADDLTLTAGLRWSREEKEAEFNQYLSDFVSPTSNDVAVRDSLGLGSPYWSFANGRYSNAGAVALEGGGIPLLEGEADTEIDDDFFTFKLGLDWQMTEDTLLYASFNRGIKAGGFNAPLDASLFAYGGLDPSSMTFDKETLDAYEVGFKITLFDGLARLNGSAYYYDYQDYQAFALDSLTTFVFNTDATNQGLELELQSSPVEGMDLLLGMSYADTNVEDAYNTASGPVDREVIMTPDLTFNGMIRYEWELSGGAIAAQYDFNYLDDHFFQLKNSPVVEEDAYMISNVRLTYTEAQGYWSVSAFVNNVTDEEYRSMALDLSGAPADGGFGMVEEVYGNPRWWGVNFTYNFGD